MRLTAAALLGLVFPGAGHLITGMRRVAVIFLVPLAVLILAITLVLAQGGVIGLLAFVVTPGVLPALAILNIVLAIWRLVSGADAARRVEGSRRAAGIVAASAFVLVVVPHVVLGRVIASTNDLLDSMFASGPAVVVEDGPDVALGEEPPDLSANEPIPSEEGTEDPGTTAEATDATDPTGTPGALATPVPRGPYTGGGGGNLPPLGAAVPWTTPGAVPWGSDGRFDLLLLGSDAGADRWSRRMDVMLLVEVDVATGQIAMIGLPRNLQNAPFPPGPARDAVKCGCMSGLLNEMYVEATARHPDRWPGTGAVKGIGAVRSVVSELTGRPIDAVLVADLMGVVRVVDALGGVDINVAASVYDESYPDPILGDIVLRIAAGKQHLDGRLSLAYARSRHQDSDYARMLRQQALLLAIRAQLGPAIILQAPALVAAAKGSAWTDLPRESLPNLITLFGKASSATVHQLRIVPPAYPLWLTTTAINQIRRDIARLLPPVPNSTPSPVPTPSPTPQATPSPAPSPSPSPSPGGTPAPSPSPTPQATPSPAPTPSPQPTASPSPTPSP